MRGVTLVELLVAMTILAVTLGVTGLALAGLRLPRDTAAVRAAQHAHAEAIRTGRAGPWTPDSSPARHLVSGPARPTALFLPDGRAVGRGVDPLTGDVRRAPR